MTDRPLIDSPLARVHQALGAKFAEFGGWRMPLEYAGVLAEHRGVRSGVGVFDVSHLGTFMVEGSGAVDWLNTRLTNDLTRIAPGQAQYTLLLNQAGGVIDDMIVYIFAPDKVMVLPNASNAAEVLARLKDGTPAELVWTDRHQADAIIAVQGPASTATLATAGLPTDLAYMSFLQTELSLASTVPGEESTPVERRVALTVCRTGYTGEHGYELVVPAEAAEAVWRLVMAAGATSGIQPCGLGARDTLRLEMGYPLHGNDLSPEISPVEARLGWAVGWKKPHFDGDEAVRAQRRDGASRTLLGITAAGRGIARHGMAVVDEAGAPVGLVTSGTFSPTLKQGIGLALLPATVAVGDQVEVDVRGRREPFDVVKPPFVPSHVTD